MNLSANIYLPSVYTPPSTVLSAASSILVTLQYSGDCPKPPYNHRDSPGVTYQDVPMTGLLNLLSDNSNLPCHQLFMNHSRPSCLLLQLSSKIHHNMSNSTRKYQDLQD
ncbi:hypothetical protein Pcinc_020311 [Petrolisthes cinctipes]|uniref:Uncharacterized protein n=1 Tax=Petrolisthes cinctipes TaxID=88211 RepID=A0AAE1FJE3_PETCI|nr:hypothetical protein Pcinc_020311 [Petrolisthes cinctipes]